MNKEWVECWCLTILCIVIAVISWFGNDPETTGYAIGGAILLPSFKWCYSKD